MPKGIPASGRRRLHVKVATATSFGKLVREWRMARNWTQYDLAAAAGLATSYVTQLENAAKLPTRAVVVAFARAFELDHESTVELSLRAASERVLL